MSQVPRNSPIPSSSMSSGFGIQNVAAGGMELLPESDVIGNMLDSHEVTGGHPHPTMWIWQVPEVSVSTPTAPNFDTVSVRRICPQTSVQSPAAQPVGSSAPCVRLMCGCARTSVPVAAIESSGAPGTQQDAQKQPLMNTATLQRLRQGMHPKPSARTSRSYETGGHDHGGRSVAGTCPVSRDWISVMLRDLSGDRRGHGKLVAGRPVGLPSSLPGTDRVRSVVPAYRFSDGYVP